MLVVELRSRVSNVMPPAHLSAQNHRANLIGLRFLSRNIENIRLAVLTVDGAVFSFF